MSDGRVVLACPPLPGGPSHDVALGPALLEVGLGGAQEVLRVHSPVPTAAFSRRDTLQPGFADAVAAVRRWGSTPVVRFPGGRLAAYHQGSVVVEHVRRSSRPDLDVEGRFADWAGTVARVLTAMGVDARIGKVPGEYCPGAFTVNAAGTTKLAGSAQRVTRRGWLVSTVVQVTGAAELRGPLADASSALGYDLDLATVGAVEDHAPGVTVAEVATALSHAWAGDAADVVRALPEPLLAAVERIAAGNALPG